MFKLESFEGMPLEGYYYTHELSRVRGEPLYRIESILRSDQEGPTAVSKLRVGRFDNFIQHYFILQFQFCD